MAAVTSLETIVQNAKIFSLLRFITKKVLKEFACSVHTINILRQNKIKASTATVKNTSIK